MLNGKITLRWSNSTTVYTLFDPSKKENYATNIFWTQDDTIVDKLEFDIQKKQGTDVVWNRCIPRLDNVVTLNFGGENHCFFIVKTTERLDGSKHVVCASSAILASWTYMLDEDLNNSQPQNYASKARFFPGGAFRYNASLFIAYLFVDVFSFHNYSIWKSPNKASSETSNKIDGITGTTVPFTSHAKGSNACERLYSDWIKGTLSDSGLKMARVRTIVNSDRSEYRDVYYIATKQYLSGSTRNSRRTYTNRYVVSDYEYSRDLTDVLTGTIAYCENKNSSTEAGYFYNAKSMAIRSESINQIYGKKWHIQGCENFADLDDAITSNFEKVSSTSPYHARFELDPIVAEKDGLLKMLDKITLNIAEIPNVSGDYIIAGIKRCIDDPRKTKFKLE